MAAVLQIFFIFFCGFEVSYCSNHLQVVFEMDERAAIPVTLPKANSTTSYWQDPPDADIAEYCSAEFVPDIANTVIIGSGITGTSVAHELLETGGTTGKLVMLEARQACSGATGRNGLFLQRYLLFFWG